MRHLLLFSLLAAQLPASVLVPRRFQNDIAFQMASEDLRDALGKSRPGIRIQLSPGAWKPPKADGYRIRPAARRTVAVEGDVRGTLYGAFKLAERIRLGDDPSTLRLEHVPAFPIRMFAEQGQMLDLPDVGYYSDHPPYVNQARVRQDVDALKRDLRQVLKLGFNAFSFLNLNVEEYVDYKFLSQRIYPAGDRHLQRSQVFSRLLTELCEYAHKLHLEIYVQPYEMSYPPRLDALYGVNIQSPNIEQIISARYRELFERVPLDGVVVTPTEPHPRAGYKAKYLWKTIPEAARMAVAFHKAAQAAGRKSIFRLWLVAKQAEAFEEISNLAPDDLLFTIKNTGTDFYLSSPLTTAISSGLPKRQPLIVEFDTFREYDGWSRYFCYMKRWKERLAVSRDNGVAGISAWGPWSPGCINSDNWGPTPPHSWIGRWNDFRMFSSGFTPGLSNVYLISRLAFDPDASLEAITREFCQLHLGAANADAAARALLLTEDAFHEQYLPGAVPYYIKWTMLFWAPSKQLEAAYAANTLETVLESNRRALSAAAEIERAFSKVDLSRAPAPETARAFAEGVAKTVLYIRTYYGWRECWWRWRSGRDASAALESLRRHLETWKAKYPREASAWLLTDADPNAAFWAKKPMVNWLERFGAPYQKP